jgi:hypothetical protein
MEAEELAPLGGQDDLRLFARWTDPLEVAGVDRCLPHGEAGTGRSPGLHQLRIRPGRLRAPFQEVEHQRFEVMVVVQSEPPR